MRAAADPDGRFIRSKPNAPSSNGAFAVTDLIIVVLSTTGLTLMAAYASLCDRI